MKRIILYFIALGYMLVLISCADNDKDGKFQESELIGRWEFSHQIINGVLQTVYPNEYCKYDQVYEFHGDGTVTCNDPCQWNNLTESKANWKIVDNKLAIDYYAIPGLSVNPVIISIENDELTLQQMYGDADVVHNVFRRTQKGVIDYAAEAVGRYEGWMNYSEFYISDIFRGDSVFVEISVTRNNWGNISVQYNDIDILGSRKGLLIDSIQTTRYQNMRQFSLDSNTGVNMLYLNQDSIYNIRTNGNIGTINKDSIYFALNFSKIEFEDPENTSSNMIERYYQYQRFSGIRKR